MSTMSCISFSLVIWPQNSILLLLTFSVTQSDFECEEEKKNIETSYKTEKTSKNKIFCFMQRRNDKTEETVNQTIDIL